MIKKLFKFYLPVFMGIVFLLLLIWIVIDRFQVPANQNWPSAEIPKGITWEQYAREYLQKNPQPNALEHYLKAMDMVFSDRDGHITNNAYRQGKFNITPEIIILVNKKQEYLDEVRTGSRMDNCSLPPMPYNMAAPVPKLFQIQGLGKLLILSGKIKEQQNRYSEAIDDYFACLQLGRDFCQKDQSLITHLVAFALMSLPQKPLQELIIADKLSKNDYQKIIETSERIDREQASISEALITEYRTLYSLEDRITQNPIQGFTSDGPGKQFFGARGWSKYIIIPIFSSYLFLNRGRILKDCYDLYVPAITQLSTKPYPEVLPLLKGEKTKPRTMINRIAIPNILSAYTRQLIGQSKLRLTAIQAATRLYYMKNNQYPNSMEQLAPNYLTALPRDPFTGENFVWVNRGTVPFAYSLGPDAKDDEGILSYDPTNGTLSSGDIVPVTQVE